MNELMEVYDRVKRRLNGLKIEIYHSSILDYNVTIYFGSVDDKEVVVNVQHCDYDYVFAKAHVLFKEWLLEKHGGY